MRRSNWKSKLVVVIAVIIGILCGLAAAYFVNQKFGAALYWIDIFYHHASCSRTFDVFDDPCVSYRRIGGKRR